MGRRKGKKEGRIKIRKEGRKEGRMKRKGGRREEGGREGGGKGRDEGRSTCHLPFRLGALWLFSPVHQTFL